MSRASVVRWWLHALAGLALALLAGALGERASSADATEAQQPAPTYAAVSYRMHAELDVVEHRVAGSASIRWQNRSHKAQEELWLHLYLNAFKNERSTFLRSTASEGFRGGGRPEQWGYLELSELRIGDDDLLDAVSHPDPEDETDARVALPRPVLPGEWLEIEVRWTAQLPSVSHRTGFAKSFHMVAQWFPKLAVLEPDGSWSHFPFHRLSEFYADYGDYDVTIEAPRDFVIGATGALVEEAADGERMRWRYRQDDVHDFAFTAWDGFAVAERDGPGGVKLRCLYPRGEDALGALELDMVVLGLERYGEAYGPYPYGTLTVVHPPTGASDAGGMEYPTLITTGGSWWHPWLGFRSIEGVTLHELGHQWFYGMVGSNEYRWAFLDEGLTTWATQRVMRDAFGLGSAFDGLGLTIDQASFQRAHAAGAAAIGPIAQRADAFARGSDYGKLAYSRTSTLLETLRRVWGAADLDAAIGSYARAQRFAHPTPEDLIDAVRSGVGEAAASALADGLDGGWVDFEVASLDNGANDAPQGIFGRPDAPDAAPEAEGGARRALVVIRRRGTLRFPVEIELTSAGGQERRTWDGEGDHHTIVWTGDTDLTSVVIDPDERVLIDQDLSNNVARARRQRVAPRTLSLLAYVAGLVMALVAP